MKPTDYRPPPDSACTLFEQTIDAYVDDRYGRPIRIFQRLKDYRGLVVDFCVRLYVLGDDREIDVERVDCCHGVVHRHRFDTDGIEQGRPVELLRLFDQVGAWNQVDAVCSEELDRYFGHYEEIVERWCV